MGEAFFTTVVADAPMCEHINKLGDAIIAAGHGIAIQMAQPGDTPQDFEIAGVSHALQTVIVQAHRTGMSDQALFVALATAMASFATKQELGPIHTVCQQLGIKAEKAARAVLADAHKGFPTRGNA